MKNTSPDFQVGQQCTFMTNGQTYKVKVIIRWVNRLIVQQDPCVNGMGATQSFTLRKDGTWRVPSQPTIVLQDSK